MWAGICFSTALSDLAASMAPGTWAELKTDNINATLYQGGSGASNIVPGANSGVWDDNRKVFHYVGKTAGTQPLRHVNYRASTNTWTIENNFTGGSTRGHGYDHNIGVDSETGTFYFRPGGNTIYAHPVGGPWKAESSWPVKGYVQVAIGTTLWSGALQGVTGKALIVYNSGGSNGEIQIYDITRKTWLPYIHGFGGQSTYHSGAEYSAVHNVAIVGGGNANPRKIWRLNADQSMTALTDAPVHWGGYLNANCVADPVTGNFLFMGNGQLWEYDPRGSGKYTKQTGSRVPPSTIGNPFNNEGPVSAPVPSYGVVMYVSGRGQNSRVHLYKHAAGTTQTHAQKAVHHARIAALPNPFSSEVSFKLPASSQNAQVTIYNVHGKRVAGLMVAGQGRTLTWRPKGIASGIYVVKIVTGNSKSVRRILYRP
jgi:hypothetical protein